MEYDTADIERLARQIGQRAAMVAPIRSEIAAAREEVRDDFRGLTAEALERALNDMAQDMRKLEQGLGKISQELSSFARRIKQADQDAKKLL